VPVATLMFLLDVVFIVHAAKTGRFMPWAYVIIFLPGVGALAYVVAELAPAWLGSHQGRQAQQKIGAKLNPGKRLRQLRDNLDTADTVANRAALAQECLERGYFDEALNHFKVALARPHGAAPGLYLGEARAELGLIRPRDAIATLEQFRKAFPDTQSGEGHLLYATALDVAGRSDEALHEYDQLCGYYAGAEPPVRRAALLARLGRAAEAKDAAEAVVRALNRSPKFAKKAQAIWLAQAKKIARG